MIPRASCKIFYILAVIAAGSLLRADPVATCPVTGDVLGGDKGAPIPVVYEGHTIMLCCKTCVRKFNAHPEKYVTKADPKAESAKAEDLTKSKK